MRATTWKVDRTRSTPVTEATDTRPTSMFVTTYSTVECGASSQDSSPNGRGTPTLMATRSNCVDCEYRYAAGRSPRCNICRKQREKRNRHNAHLKKRYSISIEEYDALLQAQGGACWICYGGTSKGFFAVDHDHKTGEVRGLLCANCNKTLGRFRDNPERFRRAASYLESPPARGILEPRDWTVNLHS